MPVLTAILVAGSAQASDVRFTPRVLGATTDGVDLQGDGDLDVLYCTDQEVGMFYNDGVGSS